jgi:hypothetical protein
MAVDGIKIALCAVGAFYVFAGYVATRAALTSHLIDRAIAAIEGKPPSGVETAQNYWLLSAAALVLASGVTLLFLIDVAAWLFLASSVGQAIYLFYLAPRVFDVEDAPDALGGRRSTNAFVLYLVVTALVVWAVAAGELTSLQDVSWPVGALCAALIAAHVGYVVWTIASSPRTGGALQALAGRDGFASDDPSRCTRIKVMADYHCHPLWAIDEDLYGDFAPETIGVSSELARDLNDWAEAFTSSLDPEDPAVSRWSEEERAAHDARARPLAARLAREKPDRTIYVLTPDVGVVEVRADEDI